jgi:uncharacterized protein (TIGR00297 family)
MLQFTIGLALAVLISIAAFRLQALSQGGALAAAVLGTVTFGLGGLEWAVVLIAFFASSSILSRLAKTRKAAIEEKYSKGGRRDAGQVLANGGVAGLFVLLHAFFPAAAWPWLGFSAALAATNADTWATELGVLGVAQPRSITTGRLVERGTSGGVSPAGFLASAAGALLIGLLAALLYPGSAALPLSAGANHWMAVGMVLAFTLLLGLAGLAGSLVDSLLGATLQAVYYCPACRKETERHPIHTCGSPTARLRGLAWLNNDWVNAACTISGAIFALTVYLVI